jgi:tetratricopeptide (TPR) repeat protein
MGKKEPIIKFFILAGDYQASDAFEPHQKAYRDIIEKRLGGKDYGASLIMILIQYHLEGEYWKLPEKPIKLGNYTPAGRSIGAVVGISKDFGSWSESEKRSFIISTTIQTIEMVRERMNRRGTTDMDFDGLIADLETCSREYLALPVIDGTDNLVTAWDLMKNGKYTQAYAWMTEQMEREPRSVPRYIFERAYCLLDLNQPEAALMDFQNGIALHEKNRISHQNDAVGHIGAGIAFWWLNDYSEAVTSWRRALPGRYKLVYGEVEALSFLYFAATIQNDPVLEKEVVALMETKWKSRSRYIWQDSIIGFLLGKIDRDTLINEGNKIDPILTVESKLTKIHFGLGLADYRQGNKEDYRNHLQRVLSGDMAQPEYYLAKFEIKKPG